MTCGPGGRKEEEYREEAKSASSLPRAAILVREGRDWMRKSVRRSLTPQKWALVPPHPNRRGEPGSLKDRAAKGVSQTPTKHPTLKLHYGFLLPMSTRSLHCLPTGAKASTNFQPHPHSQGGTWSAGPRHGQPWAGEMAVISWGLTLRVQQTSGF